MTVETCSLVHINTYKLNNQSRVYGNIYSFQTLSIYFIVLLVSNNIQKTATMSSFGSFVSR